MNADPFFKFPRDQAVVILHQSYHNKAGRAAIIAPTFTPGVSHFGIGGVVGSDWEFLAGPAIVRTDRLWRKLLRLDGYCPTAAIFLEKDDDWSIPTASPDHLIDLVRGKEPA